MTKHITPEFPGSFVTLVEPKKIKDSDGPPKYSMSIVLDKKNKDHKKFLKTIKADMLEVAAEKLGSVPKKLKLCIKDGDKEDVPGWEGKWIINTSSKSRPGVIDKHRDPIMDNELLYSGAIYRASISPWAWSHPTGGKGVSMNLDNVMWVKDGDRLDGRAAAEDDFADYTDDLTHEPGDDDVGDEDDDDEVGDEFD